jgi:hypothetical protein
MSIGQTHEATVESVEELIGNNELLAALRALTEAEIFATQKQDEFLLIRLEVPRITLVSKILGHLGDEERTMETLDFFAMTRSGAVTRFKQSGRNLSALADIAYRARLLWFQEYSSQYTLGIP